MRFALRMLRRNPLYTAVIVVTLALGIGANTAVFSVVDAVLLAPSAFHDPDRLVVIWGTDQASDTPHEPSCWPDVADYRERSRTLAGVAALIRVQATRAGRSRSGPSAVAASHWAGVRARPLPPAHRRPAGTRR
ncbi:MAG: ABC transporter permease [Gemmatimonadetes bacterium]|nr:ABC transporter permease [Gemmatimonadota bacterium]